MSIIVAQINTTAGQIESNFRKIIHIIEQFNHRQCLIIFPEMALSGYPCQDIWLHPKFIAKCATFTNYILKKVQKPTVVLGLPLQDQGLIYNSAIVLQGGREKGRYYKQVLPNYKIFDEKRYFTAGRQNLSFKWNDKSVALSICEDLWSDDFVKSMPNCDLLISLNASPFTKNKLQQRETILTNIARQKKCSIAYINQVGGEDELVFDGYSMLVDSTGKIVQRCAGFQEQTANWELGSTGDTKIPEQPQQLLQALQLGLKDYLRKGGFKKALVGSSGGIDSALTLCIAVNALGAENVESIMLPYQYTALESITAAKELAQNFNIKHSVVNITAAVDGINSCLSQFKLSPIALQNIQSRSRAQILMALSNSQNSLLLTTGNKSELAMGYATLYGDMCGAFNVLKDVYKTEVYNLARWINRNREVIPSFIIDREPTAELAENQLDSQTLPQYEVLDEILQSYIEKSHALEQPSTDGKSEILVEEIISQLKKNEYKRSQAPIGTRISEKAFGRDWRYPLHDYR